MSTGASVRLSVTRRGLDWILSATSAAAWIGVLPWILAPPEGTGAWLALAWVAVAGFVAGTTTLAEAWAAHSAQIVVLDPVGNTVRVGPRTDVLPPGPVEIRPGRLGTTVHVGGRRILRTSAPEAWLVAHALSETFGLPLPALRAPMDVHGALSESPDLDGVTLVLTFSPWWTTPASPEARRQRRRWIELASVALIGPVLVIPIDPALGLWWLGAVLVQGPVLPPLWTPWTAGGDVDPIARGWDRLVLTLCAAMLPAFFLPVDPALGGWALAGLGLLWLPRIGGWRSMWGATALEIRPDLVRVDQRGSRWGLDLPVDQLDTPRIVADELGRSGVALSTHGRLQAVVRGPHDRLSTVMAWIDRARDLQARAPRADDLPEAAHDALGALVSRGQDAAIRSGEAN